MFSPAVFSACLIKVDEAIQTLVGFDFPKIKTGICKVMVECTEFDDWKKLDGKYSNATLLWIADLRSKEPLVNLSLEQERLVFKTLIQIYKSK